jgi:hypothetical protein
MLLDRERRVRGLKVPQLTIRIKKTPMANTQPVPANLTVVNDSGGVGVWSPLFEQWTLLQQNNWTLKMLTQKPTDEAIYAVGTQDNYGKWDGSWVDQGKPNDWQVKMLAFNSKGTMWVVGTDGNVCTTDDFFQYAVLGDLGTWQLTMLAFDRKGAMWGLKTDGTVGTWNGGGWDERDDMSNSDLQMLAFDTDDKIWGLMGGNLCSWTDTGWQSLGGRGGWNLNWLYFT